MTPEQQRRAMDDMIAQLAPFPWGQTVAFYRSLCNKDPSQRLACDPNFRAQSIQDLEALQAARANNVLLNLPAPPAHGGGDYAVGDPFALDGSMLMKQWVVVQKGILEAQAAAAEKAAAAAANANAQAAAAAAAQAAALAAGQTAAEAKAVRALTSSQLSPLF
jgi:hypothetical protein